MLSFYSHYIDSWEQRLASRDTNRVVRPFEWGLDWLGFQSSNGHSPAAELRRLARQSLLNSGEFFAHERPRDFELNKDLLTFTSPLLSPYAENNTVYGRFFPAKNARGRAVVVLPQWNADAEGHIGLCKLLNRFSISALRMSMAYHDRRMPPELERADYHVSSNIGRTIHASRQSVMDARACLDFLEEQGYTKLAILGTSLGSCIAFITAAHDRRISVGVFNHVSMYFSDVVWTGLSTQHVRRGFGEEVTQDDLRDYWSVISPASYFDRLRGRTLRSLLIWACFDTTFLPLYSRQVLSEFSARGLDHSIVKLPCAHYTTGRFPFNWMDGLAMCRFLRRNL